MNVVIWNINWIYKFSVPRFSSEYDDNAMYVLVLKWNTVKFEHVHRFFFSFFKWNNVVNYKLRFYKKKHSHIGMVHKKKKIIMKCYRMYDIHKWYEKFPLKRLSLKICCFFFHWVHSIEVFIVEFEIETTEEWNENQQHKCI